VLFSFRSHYLFAIGLETIFSLRRSTPASLHSTLKLRDFWNNGGKRKRTSGHERDDSPLWWNFSERLFHWASTNPQSPSTTIHNVSDSFDTDSEIGFCLTQVTRRYHRYDGCCLFLPLMICLSSGGHPALQRWFLKNNMHFIGVVSEENQQRISEMLNLTSVKNDHNPSQRRRDQTF
jgi:hypothetical protein